MDSRLAADPVARQIIETLATLEKAAGVRAHYRILDPPPLSSTDPSAIQTVARVLGDWIGLRNAMFDISIIEHDEPPRLVRVDPDHEEFAMEISSRALTSTETALAAVTRQVSRAYLINSNIAASSVDPARTSGSLADITTIFLGMGKLILNAPAAGSIALSRSVPQTAEHQSLAPEYLAFTHRLVCAMRGLDWAQHTSGLNAQAIANLRKWDDYRDSVFSQALRNVLTASASHRPLQDAIEDNHLALSRFDQLQRTFTETVIVPLQKEMQDYHRTCREGAERLVAREQDTYDPCLLYLNQLRRRMDLQRYADMLHAQQDHIINRLRILTAGLSDLGARNLIITDHAAEGMTVTHCPFDGTPLSIDPADHDTRVKCQRCGYAFLAIAGLPQISALKKETASLNLPQSITAGEAATGDSKRSAGADKSYTPSSSENTSARKRKNFGATMLITGFVLLPLSWLPMLGYVLWTIIQAKEAPLTDTLGQVGILGSILGGIFVIVGLCIIALRYTRNAGSRPTASEAPLSDQPEPTAAR